MIMMRIMNDDHNHYDDNQGLDDDISKVGPRPQNSSSTVSGLERELRNILRQQKLKKYSRSITQATQI